MISFQQPSSLSFSVGVQRGSPCGKPHQNQTPTVWGTETPVASTPILSSTSCTTTVSFRLPAVKQRETPLTMGVIEFNDIADQRPHRMLCTRATLGICGLSLPQGLSKILTSYLEILLHIMLSSRLPRIHVKHAQQRFPTISDRIHF